MDPWRWGRTWGPGPAGPASPSLPSGPMAGPMAGSAAGPPILVGERVLWLGSGSGLPQGAVVRWMGKLPEMGPSWTLGIELDEALPFGGIDGWWGGRRLFACEPRRGLLVPLSSVVRDVVPHNGHIGPATTWPGWSEHHHAAVIPPGPAPSLESFAGQAYPKPAARRKNAGGFVQSLPLVEEETRQAVYDTREHVQQQQQQLQQQQQQQQQQQLQQPTAPPGDASASTSLTPSAPPRSRGGGGGVRLTRSGDYSALSWQLAGVGVGPGSTASFRRASSGEGRPGGALGRVVSRSSSAEALPWASLSRARPPPTAAAEPPGPGLHPALHPAARRPARPARPARPSTGRGLFSFLRWFKKGGGKHQPAGPRAADPYEPGAVNTPANADEYYEQYDYDEDYDEDDDDDDDDTVHGDALRASSYGSIDTVLSTATVSSFAFVQPGAAYPPGAGRRLPLLADTDSYRLRVRQRDRRREAERGVSLRSKYRLYGSDSTIHSLWSHADLGDRVGLHHLGDHRDRRLSDALQVPAADHQRRSIDHRRQGEVNARHGEDLQGEDQRRSTDQRQQAVTLQGEDLQGEDRRRNVDRRRQQGEDDVRQGDAVQDENLQGADQRRSTDQRLQGEDAARQVDALRGVDALQRVDQERGQDRRQQSDASQRADHRVDRRRQGEDDRQVDDALQVAAPRQDAGSATAANQSQTKAAAQPEEDEAVSRRAGNAQTQATQPSRSGGPGHGSRVAEGRAEGSAQPAQAAAAASSVKAEAEVVVRRARTAEPSKPEGARQSDLVGSSRPARPASEADALRAFPDVVVPTLGRKKRRAPEPPGTSTNPFDDNYCPPPVAGSSSRSSSTNPFGEDDDDDDDGEQRGSLPATLGGKRDRDRDPLLTGPLYESATLHIGRQQRYEPQHRRAASDSACSAAAPTATLRGKRRAPTPPEQPFGTLSSAGSAATGRRNKRPAPRPPLAAEEEERLERERQLEQQRKLEEERLEKERLEKERLDKERLEKERLEKERAEKERIEAERLEAERLEKERLDRERRDRERLEKERLERERIEREIKVEQERLQREREELRRLEQEREQLERERKERERLERERLEWLRREAERLEREREETERLLEQERQEQDNIRRLEREIKLARETLERERLEKERLDRQLALDAGKLERKGLSKRAGGAAGLSAEERERLLSSISKLQAHVGSPPGSPRTARTGRAGDVCRPQAAKENAKEAAKENMAPGSPGAGGGPVSPRPWYKRSSSHRDSGGFRDIFKSLEKRHKKLDDDDWMPESGVPRLSSSTGGGAGTGSHGEQQQHQHQQHHSSSSRFNIFSRLAEDWRSEKRKSTPVSMLANISELDREAAEIVQEQQARRAALQARQDARFYKEAADQAADQIADQVAEAVAGVDEEDPERPRKNSAKELISLFNAISGVPAVEAPTPASPTATTPEARKSLFGSRARSGDAEDRLRGWFAKIGSSSSKVESRAEPVYAPGSEAAALSESSFRVTAPLANADDDSDLGGTPPPSGAKTVTSTSASASAETSAGKPDAAVSASEKAVKTMVSTTSSDKGPAVASKAVPVGTGVTSDRVNGQASSSQLAKKEEHISSATASRMTALTTTATTAPVTATAKTAVVAADSAKSPQIARPQEQKTPPSPSASPAKNTSLASVESKTSQAESVKTGGLAASEKVAPARDAAVGSSSAVVAAVIPTSAARDAASPTDRDRVTSASASANPSVTPSANAPASAPATPSATPSASALLHGVAVWVCPRCTLENPRWRFTCDACSMWRPAERGRAAREEDADQPAGPPAFLSEDKKAQDRALGAARAGPAINWEQELKRYFDKDAAAGGRRKSDNPPPGSVKALTTSSGTQAASQGQVSAVKPQASAAAGSPPSSASGQPSKSSAAAAAASAPTQQTAVVKPQPSTTFIGGRLPQDGPAAAQSAGPRAGLAGHRLAKSKSQDGHLLGGQAAKTAADVEELRRARLAFFRSSAFVDDVIADLASTGTQTAGITALHQAQHEERAKLREMLKEIKDSLPSKQRGARGVAGGSPGPGGGEANPDEQKAVVVEGGAAVGAAGPPQQQQAAVKPAKVSSSAQTSAQVVPVRKVETTPPTRTAALASQARPPQGPQGSAPTPAPQARAPQGANQGAARGGAPVVKGGMLFTSLRRDAPGARRLGSGTFELIRPGDFASRASATPLYMNVVPQRPPPRPSAPPAAVLLQRHDSSPEHRSTTEEFATPSSSSVGSSSGTPSSLGSASFSSRSCSESSSSSSVAVASPRGRPGLTPLPLSGSGAGSATASTASSSSRSSSVETPPSSAGRLSRAVSTESSIASSSASAVSATSAGLSVVSDCSEVDRLTEQLSAPQGIADFRAALHRAQAAQGVGADGGGIPDVNTLAVNRLLRRLEATIAGGHHQEAARLARDLARLKISCCVTRQPKQAKQQDFITVDMYVEDQVSHQGPIPLQVTTSMTVAELAAKVAREFQLPERVQRWILGKRLASDWGRSLRDHDVTSSGAPVFLYLVAPEPDAEVDDGAVLASGGSGPAGGGDGGDVTETATHGKRLPPPPTVGRDPERRGGWYYNYEEDRYSFCEDSDEELSDGAAQPNGEPNGMPPAMATASPLGGARAVNGSGLANATPTPAPRRVASPEARPEALPRAAASPSPLPAARTTTPTTSSPSPTPAVRVTSPIPTARVATSPVPSVEPARRPVSATSAATAASAAAGPAAPEAAVVSPVPTPRRQSGSGATLAAAAHPPVRPQTSGYRSNPLQTVLATATTNTPTATSAATSPPPVRVAPARQAATTAAAPGLAAAASGAALTTPTAATPTGTTPIGATPAAAKTSASTSSSGSWRCPRCTLLNSGARPGCAACTAERPAAALVEEAGLDPDEQERRRDRERERQYQLLVNLERQDLVSSREHFECPVCLTEHGPGDGVVLRECLHTFCRTCLIHTVQFSDDAEVKCPYRDKQYACDGVLQEREIKALVPPALYEQHLAKSMSEAERKMKNAFHCKTPDCAGWCVFEDNVNEFRCPVCRATNCLTCQAIHGGANCAEYQARLQREAADGSNEDARRTQAMLEEMVARGEALACPSCQVVLMKKWGCDWLRCSMCKTEICWVTRKPRWGPGGKGDTTGGCQCGVNGVKCHPKCNYCH